MQIIKNKSRNVFVHKYSLLCTLVFMIIELIQSIHISFCYSQYDSPQYTKYKIYSTILFILLNLCVCKRTVMLMKSVGCYRQLMFHSLLFETISVICGSLVALRIRNQFIITTEILRIGIPIAHIVVGCETNYQALTFSLLIGVALVLNSILYWHSVYQFANILFQCGGLIFAEFWLFRYHKNPFTQYQNINDRKQFLYEARSSIKKYSLAVLEMQQEQKDNFYVIRVLSQLNLGEIDRTTAIQLQCVSKFQIFVESISHKLGYFVSMENWNCVQIYIPIASHPQSQTIALYLAYLFHSASSQLGLQSVFYLSQNVVSFNKVRYGEQQIILQKTEDSQNIVGQLKPGIYIYGKLFQAHNYLSLKGNTFRLSLNFIQQGKLQQLEVQQQANEVESQVFLQFLISVSDELLQNCYSSNVLQENQPIRQKQFLNLKHVMQFSSFLMNKIIISQTALNIVVDQQFQWVNHIQLFVLVPSLLNLYYWSIGTTNYKISVFSFGYEYTFEYIQLFYLTVMGICGLIQVITFLPQLVYYKQHLGKYTYFQDPLLLQIVSSENQANSNSQQLWRKQYASMLRLISVINTIAHIIYIFSFQQQFDFVLQITTKYDSAEQSTSVFPMIMVTVMYFYTITLLQSNVTLVPLSHISYNFLMMQVQNFFIVYLLSQYSIIVVAFYLSFQTIFISYYVDQTGICRHVLTWQEEEIDITKSEEKFRAISMSSLQNEYITSSLLRIADLLSNKEMIQSEITSFINLRDPFMNAEGNSFITAVDNLCETLKNYLRPVLFFKNCMLSCVDCPYTLVPEVLLRLHPLLSSIPNIHLVIQNNRIFLLSKDCDNQLYDYLQLHISVLLHVKHYGLDVSSGISFGNISACLMGIMLKFNFDGPCLRDALNANEQSKRMDNAICLDQEATQFLIHSNQDIILNIKTNLSLLGLQDSEITGQLKDQYAVHYEIDFEQNGRYSFISNLH